MIEFFIVACMIVSFIAGVSIGMAAISTSRADRIWKDYDELSKLHRENSKLRFKLYHYEHSAASYRTEGWSD